MSNEPETNTLRDTVCEGAFEKYGVDPSFIFCLMTGRPIGESYEVGELIDSLVGETQQLIDDVVMRCLASMRPSMRWNRMRVETLDQMRVAHPVETMCYLLNRLLAPTKDQKDVGFQELHRNKIRLFSHIAATHPTTNPDAWNRVMLALLTIEARAGLLTQESPIHYANLLAEESPIEAIADRLEKWQVARVEYFDEQEAEARFFAANPGARRAMMTLFWEVKPKSENQIKREAKQKDANTLGAMLDELLSPGISLTKPESRRPEMPTNIKTVARPSTQMPRRFGVAKKVEG